MDSSLDAAPDVGSNATDRTAWTAVWCVAFGVFCLVTSELFPVGLLGAVATDLGTSTGTTGLMVTVPGLVAAVAAPVVAVRARTADRRRVLVGLQLVVVVGNLATAAAPTLALVLVARIAVGVGVGGFWALAAGLAPRLVAPAQVGPASSVIFGGVAAASVLGVPLLATIGAATQWRWAAVTVAVLGLVAAGAVARLAPPMPAPSDAGTGGVPLRAAIGLSSTVLLVTLLLVVGHFSAFTFAAPVLEHVSGLTGTALPPVLLGYGVAGLLGTFLAGRLSARRPRTAVQLVAAAMALVVLLLALLDDRPAGAVGATIGWGLLYGAVGVTLQLWLLAAAGEAADLATSAFVSVFNVSIAAGAALGGRAIDTTGSERSALVVAGCLLALASVAAFLRPRLSPTTEKESPA